MATKQEIIQKQRSVYTQNPDLTDWSEVEETLHTDPASIVENFYGLKTIDENTGGVLTSNVITSVSTDLSYKIFITKNGTRVNFSGFIRNNTGTILPSNTVFFTITNNDYLMQNTTGINPYQEILIASNYNTSFATFDVDRIALRSNQLSVTNAVSINSILRFSITYNTKD